MSAELEMLRQIVPLFDYEDQFDVQDRLRAILVRLELAERVCESLHFSRKADDGSRHGSAGMKNGERIAAATIEVESALRAYRALNGNWTK